MIDLHTHLLPGVDDGSPSVEVSVPILERFAREGVSTLVCTPHLDASKAANAPFDQHAELLETLQAAAPVGPRLLQGWEIMLDQPGVDLTHPGLGLGGSRALLVEFAIGGIPRGAVQELRRIASEARTPVLAHPERYFGCTVELVREFRRVGSVIQTDVKVLLGRGTPSRLARALLAAGLVDILASDNHGDSRALSDARSWLKDHKATDEQIDLLTHTNAERVLADEDPVPVPPLETRSSLERLQTLFGQ